MGTTKTVFFQFLEFNKSKRDLEKKLHDINGMLTIGSSREVHESFADRILDLLEEKENVIAELTRTDDLLNKNEDQLRFIIRATKANRIIIDPPTAHQAGYAISIDESNKVQFSNFL